MVGVDGSGHETERSRRSAGFVIRAGGWGVPFAWDGRHEGLPAGYDTALVQAVGGSSVPRRGVGWCLSGDGWGEHRVC